MNIEITETIMWISFATLIFLQAIKIKKLKNQVEAFEKKEEIKQMWKNWAKSFLTEPGDYMVPDEMRELTINDAIILRQSTEVTYCSSAADGFMVYICNDKYKKDNEQA